MLSLSGLSNVAKVCEGSNRPDPHLTLRTGPQVSETNAFAHRVRRAVECEGVTVMKCTENRMVANAKSQTHTQTEKVSLYLEALQARARSLPPLPGLFWQAKLYKDGSRTLSASRDTQ